jgi:hypothetical protein
MFRTSLKNIVFLTTILLSSNVFAVEFQGKFIQGHFILGKTHPDSKIWVDKRKVKITEDGYFVFGIGRDRKYNITITKEHEGNKERIVKKVLKRKYKIQRIDGLEEKKVTPPKEVYERIKRENKIIGVARSVESDLTFFKKKFINPWTRR